MPLGRKDQILIGDFQLLTYLLEGKIVFFFFLIKMLEKEDYDYLRNIFKKAYGMKRV